MSSAVALRSSFMSQSIFLLCRPFRMFMANGKNGARRGSYSLFHCLTRTDSPVPVLEPRGGGCCNTYKYRYQGYSRSLLLTLPLTMFLFSYLEWLSSGHLSCSPLRPYAPTPRPARVHSSGASPAPQQTSSRPQFGWSVYSQTRCACACA